MTGVAGPYSLKSPQFLICSLVISENRNQRPKLFLCQLNRFGHFPMNSSLKRMSMGNILSIRVMLMSCSIEAHCG